MNNVIKPLFADTLKTEEKSPLDILCEKNDLEIVVDVIDNIMGLYLHEKNPVTVARMDLWDDLAMDSDDIDMILMELDLMFSWFSVVSQNRPKTVQDLVNVMYRIRQDLVCRLSGAEREKYIKAVQHRGLKNMATSVSAHAQQSQH